MNILIWMVLGGVLGWLSSLYWTIDEEMGMVSNIAVGMTGALCGGWLMTIIAGEGLVGFDGWSLIVALLSAIVFIGMMSGFRARVGRGY